MSIDEIWRYFKWPITIIALAVIFFVSLSSVKTSWKDWFVFDVSGSRLLGGDSEANTESSEGGATGFVTPGTGPITDGVYQAIATLGVTNSVVSEKADSYRVSDTPVNRMVVAFDVPQGNPACLDSMQVNMEVLSNNGTVVLGSYVSSVTNPTSLTPGSEAPSDLVLSPNAYTYNALGDKGKFNADITPMLASWFTMNHTAGTPFTLTFAPAEAVAPEDWVELKANPTLTIKGTPGCS